MTKREHKLPFLFAFRVNFPINNCYTRPNDGFYFSQGMTESVQIQSLNQFALNDRLANYGDGVFTTMHVSDGKVGLMSRHIARLVNDAAALGLTVSKDSIEQLITQALMQRSDGVLKILIGSGQGGRGYSRPDTLSLSAAVSWHLVPAFYDDWRSNGIALGVSPITLAQQPLLAGLKHANRLEQVLVKRAMQNMHCDDCIVTDRNKTIIEASAANVFWYKQGTWFTPELSQAGVNGVMRQFILQHVNNIEVGEYHLRNLADAEAIMLTNALMQIVPAHSLVMGDQSNIVKYSLEPVHALQTSLKCVYNQESACA